MNRRSPLLDRLPPRAAFSVKEAAHYGVPKASLYRLRDAGLIEQLGHGLYIAAEGLDADLDLVEAAHKAPLATLCLNSALARHGLIDEIPLAIDLAIPRGKTPPQVLSPVNWHIFDRATFEVGRSETPIDGADGAMIGIYSPERSIVDAFRLRATAGYETGIEALRNWLKRSDSHPGRLMQVASAIPRSGGPLRRALEVLL
ncbi:type IV toxin-antitoxin system AbiEi family antitoxin domain-containing protein [Paenarthrobacter sp. NPDC057355]|uniref:type IV toxin-antitoxin system AbiEi family antitoxin domain-containing protein n=1 Tax=Paenarthrobacter sp. NPDC057355 TaxID=3346105 RepID=UPI00362F21EA